MNPGAEAFEVSEVFPPDQDVDSVGMPDDDFLGLSPRAIRHRVATARRGDLVTAIADDRELVSFGPFAVDLPMAIAKTKRIVHLAGWQHDGEIFRARVL